jgi:hypothetical protein
MILVMVGRVKSGQVLEMGFTPVDDADDLSRSTIL